MEPFSKYATIETTVAAEAVNQDMGLSDKLYRGVRCVISTDLVVTVKLNNTSADSFTIATNDSVTIENLFIHEIFISNASLTTAANVKIFIVGKGL